jgi:hypothetical protein
MFGRQVISLGLTLVLLGFIAGCALFNAHTQDRDAILEQWETQNKTFKIRVTSYRETGVNVNGAYYRFESAASGSNGWHEVVTFRHDDQPKIPADQVRFLNDHIGYLFMGWVYAVTIDGGSNWSIWNATNDLPNWQCCNYKLIRDVQLAANGIGTMQLNAIPDRQGEVPELHTNDYGRHWTAR